MNKFLNMPFDSIKILRKHKSIKRELLGQKNLIEKKIFVASGTTINEIISILEIFLLNSGIKPIFFEGNYGLFYEELVYPSNDLEAFRPDIIFIHTSIKNLQNLPDISDSEAQIAIKLQNEINKFIDIWESIYNKFNCPIIQNNFELPHTRDLGNLDFSHRAGVTNYINAINQKFAEQSREKNYLNINDINYLSAWHGIENWFSNAEWHRSKHSVSLKYVPYLAHNVSSLILALYGKNKKGLVLDLDNTLWGGVIGDDGVDGIGLDKGDPTSEAYLEFQSYIKRLHARGIILTVASKNELTNAIEGIRHPNMIIKESDFAIIKANWENKAENIQEIAKQLNIFEDSLVFLDDNPAEREVVSQFLPDVSVLDLNEHISDYINILDKSKYFETLDLSDDDFKRNKTYKSNFQREELAQSSLNYEDYLISLKMKAEILESDGKHLDRITQLINKTNQFNLTTIRYSSSEVAEFQNAENKIVLYGRLEDAFGDNGIISVIICSRLESELLIDLWVMSCRVFKRNMEYAMLDEVIKIAKKIGCKTIKGIYIPTEKNMIVKGLYKSMGFRIEKEITSNDNSQTWTIDVDEAPKLNNVIDVNK